MSRTIANDCDSCPGIRYESGDILTTHFPLQRNREVQRAREYASFNGWTVTEVYDLAGVSGKTVMEHPEAKRMLADIRRGQITALQNR